MMQFLAQAEPPNFWNGINGSAGLWTMILVALALGIGLIFLLMAVPVRGRRPIVATVTFFAGLYYVLYYFWPKPIDRKPLDLPANGIESVGFWLSDAMPVVSSFTNVLSGFLLGLGIYSLLRVHGRRVIKMQKDWFFSIVLMVSAIVMVIVGYMDWVSRRGPTGALLEDRARWGPINYARDFMFDG
ncbi:MAG: hypothetical protein QOJ65_319, partial [Fimbriimonadaceae bacterium]|nr:hypothetical protein [Fimbriimonadaceae bacterium]